MLKEYEENILRKKVKVIFEKNVKDIVYILENSKEIADIMKEVGAASNLDRKFATLGFFCEFISNCLLELECKDGNIEQYANALIDIIPGLLYAMYCNISGIGKDKVENIFMRLKEKASNTLGMLKEMNDRDSEKTH